MNGAALGLLSSLVAGSAVLVCTVTAFLYKAKTTRDGTPERSR